MQKKSKTILTAVLTALFVLSVGYFALLAPTTAWYYQKEDRSYDFTFGDFDMDIDWKETPLTDITFRGATRFADDGEELFDEMLHIIKVKVKNEGESNGSVRVTVWQNGAELPLDNAQGLRWFVYEKPQANTTVKSKIDDMLTAWNPGWPIDYNTLTLTRNAEGATTLFTDYGQVSGEAESKYESYNADALAALTAYNKRGVTVPTGTTSWKEIHVAFWVEYGAAKTSLGVGSSPSARNTPIPTLTFSNLSLRIDAMPDIGGTDTTSLTISNGASAAVSVKLYRWTSDWTLYTDSTYTNGVISVSANGSATIADLPVGARYKLEIVGSSSVHFSGSDIDPKRETNDTGTVVTGTLTAGTNSVAIAANASS